LTQKQIEDSPSFEIDQTVSRQLEAQYNNYYGVPKYWNDPHISGTESNLARETNMRCESVPNAQIRGHQLHNVSDVNDYDIEASDGEIGDVKDFIIDDETWAIRYLIVDARGWLSGKKVLISPQWIERVSWEESKVFVNLSRDAIEHSPEFTQELTRDYVAGLYKHYNRQGYWTD